MNLITPIHQFEIRYSNILNFPLIARNAIAPFVKLANRINIDNDKIERMVTKNYKGMGVFR